MTQQDKQTLTAAIIGVAVVIGILSLMVCCPLVEQQSNHDRKIDNLRYSVIKLIEQRSNNYDD